MNARQWIVRMLAFFVEKMMTSLELYVPICSTTSTRYLTGRGVAMIGDIQTEVIPPHHRQGDQDVPHLVTREVDIKLP